MKWNSSHLIRITAFSIILGMISSPSFSQTMEERQQRGIAVLNKLSGGQTQPILKKMHEEFPFLATAIESYAGGDVLSRSGLDDKTRELAIVSAFATTGQTEHLKTHARYALNVGVSEDELKEIVYLVTMIAGFPRALSASQTLSEVFAERQPHSANQ